MGVKQANQDSSSDSDDENDEDLLKHSDSYERSGREDPDEELLGDQQDNQVQDRQQYRTQRIEESTNLMDTIDNNNDEATNDDLFEKLLCKDENLDGDDKVNDDLSHYFSNNTARPIIHS